MVVGIKDAAKLIGIAIISCCAVLVCTLFMNFYFDILKVEELITSEPVRQLYDAQVSSSVMVSSVSGGCLLLTSVIMLLFYIKNYIDTHKKELGILKALGYSNLKVAKNFWVFGISILIGTAAGYAGAFLLMPMFYDMQNEGDILPKVTIQFNPEIVICFVVIPTVAFALLSVFYAFVKLHRPVLKLLREDMQSAGKPKKHKKEKAKDQDCSFVTYLKRNTLRSRKTLTFFIFFSSFCFSSMTQMAASIGDYASDMMAIMMLVIGLVLAGTTLFLAITTVVRGNTKTIAMMRVFGYSQKECCSALLGGYRPMSYIGFLVGTGYQYLLMNMLLQVIFMDYSEVPEYAFDVPVTLISLAAFIVIYELMMHWSAESIKNVSVKEIMLES